MGEAPTETARDFAWRTVGLGRLAIGLLQGLALFLLHEAFEAKAWPTTVPPLFAALTLAALLAPFVALAGLGALRRGTLVAWGLAATAMIALLAAYDIWRDPAESYGGALRLLPTPAVWAATAAALFIAHHLIEPA
ncbi:MAG: hypothetical protein JWP92_488, partial [Caulobacter sp.]|nr:hypothetical protein [Caulobacter sp.]